MSKKTKVRGHSRRTKSGKKSGVKQHSRKKYEGVPDEAVKSDATGQLAVANESGRQADKVQKGLPWYDKMQEVPTTKMMNKMQSGGRKAVTTGAQAKATTDAVKKGEPT